MRSSRLGPAILLAALVLHSPLRATTTEEVKVTCPVCDNKFLADELASTNSVGGYERAATPRGIDGARRRFLAELLERRRKHGREAGDLWDRVKTEGEALVRDRLAEA